MICDSGIVLERATRACSFSGLMTLYESNYLRLGWLIRDIQSIDGEHQSYVPGDCTLYLRVLERSRYTTTFNLSYYFDEDGKTVADPDLSIRVYHDARLAEALACSRYHRHEILRQFDTGTGSEISRRWARNLMLNKLLEYCSERGHSFQCNDKLRKLINNRVSRDYQ